MDDTPKLVVGKITTGPYAGRYLASIKYYYGFSGNPTLWESWSAERRQEEIIWNMGMGKLLTDDLNKADIFDVDDPWMDIVRAYDIGEIEFMPVSLTIK